MPKIILKGYIVVPEDELAVVRQALITHIDLTRKETGCLIFEVTEAEDQLGRFNVYEEFSDKSAFESHQQRVRDSDWGRVAQNVERHYEIIESTDAS